MNNQKNDKRCEVGWSRSFKRVARGDQGVPKGCPESLTEQQVVGKLGNSKCCAQTAALGRGTSSEVQAEWFWQVIRPRSDQKMLARSFGRPR